MFEVVQYFQQKGKKSSGGGYCSSSYIHSKCELATIAGCLNVPVEYRRSRSANLELRVDNIIMSLCHFIGRQVSKGKDERRWEDPAYLATF